MAEEKASPTFGFGDWTIQDWWVVFLEVSALLVAIGTKDDQLIAELSACHMIFFQHTPVRLLTHSANGSARL